MSLWQEFFGGLAEGLVSTLAGGQPNGVPAGRGSPARGRIEELCRQIPWSVDEQDGKAIKLYFNDPLVKRRTLLIYGGDDPLVAFIAYSYAFLPAGDVPQELTAHLLLRNNEISVGGWRALVDDDGDAGFAVKYYALGDGLTAASLKFIAETMLKEAAAFDEKMHAAGLLQPN